MPDGHRRLKPLPTRDELVELFLVINCPDTRTPSAIRRAKRTERRVKVCLAQRLRDDVPAAPTFPTRWDFHPPVRRRRAGALRRSGVPPPPRRYSAGCRP